MKIQYDKKREIIKLEGRAEFATFKKMTKIGNGAKVGGMKKFLGQNVLVVILKNKGRK